MHDLIIIGAGTAGCVLGERLRETPRIPNYAAHKTVHAPGRADWTPK